MGRERMDRDVDKRDVDGLFVDDWVMGRRSVDMSDGIWWFVDDGVLKSLVVVSGSVMWYSFDFKLLPSFDLELFWCNTRHREKRIHEHLRWLWNQAAEENAIRVQWIGFWTREREKGIRICLWEVTRFRDLDSWFQTE